MATLLGIKFSTAENQVSQCDEQTFRSIFEFKEAGATRAPLAKCLKQVSTEIDKALCEPTAVLWHNKEAGPQCKPITCENLVVHFNQGKFEEVLSGGGLMLYARKHRKVSMAKVLEQKPEAEFCQHPSASRVAGQVPCEPMPLLSKQMWRPKQKDLNKASGVATPQVRLSWEEKGKTPACSNKAASREVITTTIPSPDSRAVATRASLVLMSEATVPQGTHHVHSREAGTKAPQCASFPSSSSTKLALRSGAKGLSLSADSVAYAASVPKGISKASSCELKAKALSKANRLRTSIADKAPQRASLPSSSSAKLTLCSGAKGSSLNVDSVAYAASTSKGTPKVLSREARAEALFCANPLCGDKRSRTLSYARSNRASVLDRLGPTGV